MCGKVKKILAVLIMSVMLVSAFESIAQAAKPPWIVHYAYKAIGVPYRWGGTSLRGFDCSGFTQWAYARIGKRIPRTAAAQFSAGKRVRTPVPGDLVFYSTRGRISHVGMYIGGGRMISAPRTGKRVHIGSVYRGVVGYRRF